MTACLALVTRSLPGDLGVRKLPTIRKRSGQWQVFGQVFGQVLGQVLDQVLGQIHGQIFGLAKPLAAIFVLGLALAGCSQPWDPDTDGNAVACRSTYNFSPGTPDYEQCMQRFREIDARKKGGRVF